MSESRHTPTPWHWTGNGSEGCSPWDLDGILEGPNGETVIYLEIDNSAHDPINYEPFFCTTQANAEFIVRAVNCHDELVEALKTAVLHLECTDANRPAIVAPCLASARVALALAEEKQG